MVRHIQKAGRGSYPVLSALEASTVSAAGAAVYNRRHMDRREALQILTALPAATRIVRAEPSRATRSSSSCRTKTTAAYVQKLRTELQTVWPQHRIVVLAAACVYRSLPAASESTSAAATVRRSARGPRRATRRPTA
jgi:hypothetical protein